jgi:hypothetical protein
LVAFLKRSLKIASGSVKVFCLDPLEMLQALESEQVLPPSSRADHESFGVARERDSFVSAKGVNWLLEYVLGMRDTSSGEVSPEEAKTERRRLRLQEILAERWTQPDDLVSLVSVPGTSARIVRAAQTSLLPQCQSFSERALARWLISQSFITIKLDASVVIKELEVLQVVRENNCGRLSYVLLPTQNTTPSVHALVHEAAEPLPLMTIMQETKRKRINRKWTIKVIPTYTPGFLSNCRDADKTELVATLRGQRKAHGREDMASHRRSKRERCEDDLILDKCRTLWEDTNARRTRQSVRRRSRDDKNARGFDM